MSRLLALLFAPERQFLAEIGRGWARLRGRRRDPLVPQNLLAANSAGQALRRRYSPPMGWWPGRATLAGGRGCSAAQPLPPTGLRLGPAAFD